MSDTVICPNCKFEIELRKNEADIAGCEASVSQTTAMHDQPNGTISSVCPVSISFDSHRFVGPAHCADEEST